VTHRDSLRAIENDIRTAEQGPLLELVGELGRVQALAVARVASLSAEGPDRLIGVREASEKLGIGVSTLYRRAASYPFAVVDGRTVRFSSRGIERWIEARKRRSAA
jgi:predicted DNA-binding transcriptional regulator AlpA